MFDTTNTENTIFAGDNNLFDTNISTSSSYGFEASQNNINYLQGSLSADYFTIDINYDITVISGNGNVDYSSGYYDVIDLSNISVQQVVDYSFAQVNEGGRLVDTGKGERVFDYLVLANGHQVFFEGLDGVVFSDQTIDLTVNTNDPEYMQQWNLHMMGVHNAWRFTTGSDEVLIGVQDSGLGVDNNGNFHEDIQASETWYYNGNNGGLFDNLADDFLTSSSSHGTAVHGIIGSTSNNGVGIAGINWNSDVYNIDVLDNHSGDLFEAEATQAMINLANSQGKNLVVNMSIQVPGSFDNLAPFYAEFETVVANNPNTLFVVAAGNYGNQGIEGLSSPAVLAKTYDNVMAIGASWGTSDRNGLATNPGTRIEYNNSWGSQYGNGLTLMGPSEVWTADSTPTNNSTYSSKFDGTSAAAPNVTGVASLVWSANRNLTAAQVKDILSDTAYDLGQQGYDKFYGHGFINADAAVRRAIALGRNSNFSSSSYEDLFNQVYELISDSFNTFSENQPSFSSSSSSSGNSLEDSDNQIESNHTFDYLLEQVQSELPDSVFDYEAIGMKDILELSESIVKDGINSPSLSAELLVA